ncbi:hypothetical protein EV179_003866 [Coemansia sp. RSA 487]|nr:hypothetical protein EV179_003866 [Coemansia sp. RSA 487]
MAPRPRVQRTKSKAPDSPLPLPPLPYRQPPTPTYTQSISPLPPKPSTPQPLAVQPRVLEYPTEGIFDVPDDSSSSIHPADRAKYLIDTTGDGDLAFREAPAPVHRATYHRSANSLPMNVPLISAPPSDNQSSVMPSAPPIPNRIPTFMSLDHARMPSGSSHRISSSASSTGSYSSPLAYDSGVENTIANGSTTPPDDVRKVAIQDASENLNRKMFSDKVLNFRDLGVSVIKAGLKMNQSWDKAKQEGPMPGVVFRSAELGSAYEHDVKMLFSKYGIRTIIDLRSELEARASDILIKHYPASMQPTADQSLEKLMQLRAAQVRKTLVEVAAHSYETAAKPWERTGETQTSWSKRNSLKYSRSLGDPLKDPFARALAHLYDERSDPEFIDTESISRSHPYVPTVRLPPETVEQNDGACGSDRQSRPHCAIDNNISSAPEVSDMPMQYPSLAQSALDWGSETLQVLRLYWDGSWAGSNNNSNSNNNNKNADVRSSDAPNDLFPSRPAAKPLGENSVGSSIDSYPYSYENQRNHTLRGNRANSIASNGSYSSDDSFYKISEDDKTRAGTRYGLRPVGHSTVEGLAQGTQSNTLLRADAESADAFGDQNNSKEINVAVPQRSSNEEPYQVPYIPQSGPKRVIKNRFSGERRRYRCNVIGENYRKKCVWANAPWSTKIKVILRFATFNKAEAIRTIGREVLAPRTLAGSYEDYIDYCKEEFAAVMRIFADPCAYPILFHCQHGKDRTGIVAMLLLGILNVDDHIIAADYMQSEKNLAPVRQRMEMLDMGAVGLPSTFCDSPEPVMLNLLSHIRNNYGSVRGYLRSAGLKEQEINTIAWCLRGNFCGLVHEETKRAHVEARQLYLRPTAARSDIFSTPQKKPGTLPLRTANIDINDGRRGASAAVEISKDI